MHLQSDRSLEFHTPEKLHHTTRLPRYGRDLKYIRWSTEALVPAVGVNENGSGEVFRLNLEQGRFMKSYEVDVGGDDFTSLGGGALQGGINTGAVHCAAVAEGSHNLTAFGTSIGTIEFFDPRARSRVGVLTLPDVAPISSATTQDTRDTVTALEFHSSGLTLATGSGSGIIQLYDLRNPRPFWRRDQGYGYAIKNLIFVDPPANHERQKLISADMRIIKLWDIDEASIEREVGPGAQNKAPWTSIEPTVDLNHVEYVPNSGMLLTANEGGPQHIFFIPALGPAPTWCRFIDNIVEEMAEDRDPKQAAGQVYDNFKFLTLPELQKLNMDHLVGQAKAAKVLRPYMHGYFVDQRLYEQATLISNPNLFAEARAKSIQEKIEKGRESRIRGNKVTKVKVNRALAERMAAREEKHEARRARKREQLAETEFTEDITGEDADSANPTSTGNGLLADPRFAKLFEDEEFEVDETSRAFAAINPSTKPRKPTGLTAVEQEMEDNTMSTSDESSESESEEETTDRNRVSSSSYRKSGQRPKYSLKKASEPTVRVSSSSAGPDRVKSKGWSFGTRVANLREHTRPTHANHGATREVGEKSVTFTPESKRTGRERPARVDYGTKKDRRSASGNVFRKM